MAPEDESGPPMKEDDTIPVSRLEIGALLIQSVLLAAALGFTAATVLTRISPLPRGLSFGTGLLLGLLGSYPTIRLLARFDGVEFSFWKWAGVSLTGAILAILVLSVI